MRRSFALINLQPKLSRYWGLYFREAINPLLSFYFCIFIALVSTSLLGGPGIGGGNPAYFDIGSYVPNFTMNSLKNGYMFNGPIPTTVKINPTYDNYDFDLSGFSLVVEPIKYDPQWCELKNSQKTVCPTLTDSFNQENIVVFGDYQTFRVRVENKRKIKIDLKEHSQLIINSLIN